MVWCGEVWCDIMEFNVVSVVLHDKQVKNDELIRNNACLEIIAEKFDISSFANVTNTCSLNFSPLNIHSLLLLLLSSASSSSSFSFSSFFNNETNI